MNKAAVRGVSALSVAAFLWTPVAWASRTVDAGPGDLGPRVAQASQPGTQNQPRSGAPNGSMQSTPSKENANTRTNKQEARGGTPTADQQKSDKADREMTQQIRKALTDDKSLSTYAHNVKVITQGGKVTLKGPVRSDQEKQAVQDKAASIAGAQNVTNSLTIAPK